MLINSIPGSIFVLVTGGCGKGYKGNLGNFQGIAGRWALYNIDWACPSPKRRDFLCGPLCVFSLCSLRYGFYVNDYHDWIDNVVLWRFQNP
jgi:hypothetical protein